MKDGYQLAKVAFITRGLGYDEAPPLEELAEEFEVPIGALERKADKEEWFKLRAVQEAVFAKKALAKNDDSNNPEVFDAVTIRNKINKERLALIATAETIRDQLNAVMDCGLMKPAEMLGYLSLIVKVQDKLEETLKTVTTEEDDARAKAALVSIDEQLLLLRMIQGGNASVSELNDRKTEVANW